MKKILILITLGILIQGCSSLPEGKKVLAPMFERDWRNDSNRDSVSQDYYKGRPVYVKAAVYKHFQEGGDLIDDHTVHLNMGRENLSVVDLVYGKKSVKIPRASKKIQAKPTSRKKKAPYVEPKHEREFIGIGGIHDRY